MIPPNDGEVPDVVSAQGLAGCVENGGSCGLKIVGRGRCRKHYQRWWLATRNIERPPALNLKTKTPEKRFWEKVDRRNRDECWPFTGATHGFGHGQFFVSPERGIVPAHSYALEISGAGPCPEGKEACHHCDNPPCCNPKHIYFGTRLENVTDMWTRGRRPRGSAASHSKLTEEAVLAIRHRFAAGEAQPALAAEFGVSVAAISNAIRGRAWRHVGGPIRENAPCGRRPTKERTA